MLQRYEIIERRDINVTVLFQRVETYTIDSRRRKLMEIEFDVKITAGILYDYMLHHAYTSLAGILGTFIGFVILLGYFKTGYFIYLIGAAVVIFYLPCTYFMKAKQQAALTPAFQKPLHYRLTEEGIEVSQEEQVQSQNWENMVKAVSTRSSIIVYTSKNNASIFPRKDLGQNSSKVIEMISTHMQPSKVKIRA